MDYTVLLENKLSLAICSGAFGILLAVVTQYILNKRAIFGYSVWHNKVGMTADDAIYGSVKVTWNDNPISHLYLSTLVIKNESMKDFESVMVRIFTNDTMLLTQRAEIVGTARLIDFSDEYQKKIEVPVGETPRDDQLDLYRRQRDYIIPTMNRGQELKFEFLNAARTDNQPSIWADIVHKGVICKIKKPVDLIFAVPRPRALMVGTILSVCGLIITIIWVKCVLLAAIISFLLGYLVILPGVIALKATRKMKTILAG